MDLWSSSEKPSRPPPKISVDGTPIAPDRSQRAKCWEARDAYFRCLDKNEIVDSISEKDKAERACAVDGRGFEASCAASWVSVLYFYAALVWRNQGSKAVHLARSVGMV